MNDTTNHPSSAEQPRKIFPACMHGDGKKKKKKKKRKFFSSKIFHSLLNYLKSGKKKKKKKSIRKIKKMVCHMHLRCVCMYVCLQIK